MPELQVSKTVKKLKQGYSKSKSLEHVINLFKAALSEFPIGGFFSQLIDDYIPSTKALRVEKFMVETAETLVSLQDQIDETRILSDHYAYVFEQCIRGAAQYPQQEKLACYKAILINAAMSREETDEQQEYFLNLVNTLSTTHIRLLSALHAAMKIPQNGPEAGQTIHSLVGEVDGDIIMSAAAELYQLQFTNTQPGSMPMTADLSRAGGRLTPIARKFIEFVTLE